MTRICFLGNFDPPNSTENHYAEAFENIGIGVHKIQETPDIWDALPEGGLIEPNEVDFVLWTHTHGLSPESTHDAAWWALRRIKDAGVPTVAVHLDRWAGLKRQHQLYEPFFSCDYVFTADGGHQEQMEAIGINHFWLPPAVITSQTGRGMLREDFRSKIAFVGSWQGGYHEEWDHRPKLVAHLQRKWGRHCAFWPKRGQHAIRGKDLQDLYASVDVVVGDSCLAGGAKSYYSDRVPETVGRGGVLLHPQVEGCFDGDAMWINNDAAGRGSGIRMYEDGEDLTIYPAYDFKALDEKIEMLIEEPTRRGFLQANGIRKTLDSHTYEKRAEAIAWLVAGVEPK